MNYKRWLSANLIDFDLHAELAGIENDEEAIKERFAVSLKFGTAGLRGTLGAGTNRMNIWVVRQATQGVAVGLRHRVVHKLLRLVMTAV